MAKKSILDKSRIRVSPYSTYEVVFIKSFKEEDQLGECRGDRPEEPKQIVLKNGMGKRVAMKILIHELLHAVCLEYGINLRHQTIEDLEEPIYNILKLNSFIK